MISQEGVPSAIEKLRRQWEQGKFLCVGLDPDYGKIPEDVMRDYVHSKDINSPNWCQQVARVYLEFCKKIVETTAADAAAFKPNLQFFLSLGGYGILALEGLCEFIHQNIPEALLVLDGKWSDIGDTNRQSAGFAFDICHADAVTLNPLPGKEKGLQAFFDYEDKLFFVLAAMSHSGAGELGNLIINDESHLRLCEYIAGLAGDDWGTGLVVGATKPEVIKDIRAVAPHAPFLIPGVGKQGGDLARAVQAALDEHGQGFLINVSSAICYPTVEKGVSYVEAVEQAANSYNLQIQEALQQTT